MKIEIKQPKISNLYSFISNLSQWNELVCIPQRKREWLQKIGKLSKQEKEALLAFSQIFQKAEINLEPIFLFEETQKVWKIVSRKIGRTKAYKIQSIFRIFNTRFEKIWKIENKKLKIIAKKFKNKESQINKNLEILRRLCGLKKSRIPLSIEVRLLLSSTDQKDCQGWSYKEKVILECSGWLVKKINYLINNIFLHECFHILFKKNKELFSAFKLVVNKNHHLINKTKLEIWTPAVVFEEALISSFLPEGYVSEKNLKINSRKIAKRELNKRGSNNFTKLRHFCALYLYNLAKEYVENVKPLDKFYFRRVVSCIRSFLLFQNKKKGQKTTFYP